MNLKTSQALSEILSSNIVFCSGKAFPKNIRDRVYHQLTDRYHIAINQSILVSWIPEGGNSLSGHLINQDGEICFFDIDADDESISEMERCPIDDYLKNKHYYNQMKPWDYLKLAIDLYIKRKKQGAAR